LSIYINFSKLNFNAGENPKRVPVTNKHLLIFNESASELAVKDESGRLIMTLATNTTMELLDCIDGLSVLEFLVKSPASGYVSVYSFGKPSKEVDEERRDIKGD